MRCCCGPYIVLCAAPFWIKIFPKSNHRCLRHGAKWVKRPFTGSGYFSP
jgi:hypothetical protein